ncbi:MAG TPA: RsiV family protein [Ignavibacteria bacterium]|nr:RsiV family protein [Ignavibacteria bacterium]HMQ97612.1 RsiV family protein [Ignavibacteria bacterium]
MKYLLLILIAVFFISSCGKKTENSSTEQKQSTTDPKTTESSDIKFSDKSFLKSYNNCTPNDTCTYFKVDYIEAVSGNNKDKVNKLITNIINSGVTFGDTVPSTMQAAADSFMAQYISFRKDVPESDQYWYLELSVSANLDHPKMINLAAGNSSFMGGAHPNSYLEYYNISRETGDTISLGNLFIPGFEKKLNELIDAAFRKANNLKPGDNLADKGGLFDNKITFNYNWLVNKDGSLTFYYNPYEIAPYAAGPIEVTLTKADITPLLAPDSPLK